MIDAGDLEAGTEGDSESDANPPRAGHRHQVLFVLVSAAVAGWAAFVNLFHLLVPTVLSDEWVYALGASQYVHGRVAAPLPVSAAKHYITNPDNFEHPPLAKWIYGIGQLLAGHLSVAADRGIAAVATLATGALLAVWMGRVAGRWWGLLAGALVTVLPESVPGTFGTRFGRFGFLDPVMEFFVVLYLVLAWEWFTRRGRSAWAFAVALGAAVGCAAASKENGALAVIVPVLLGIGIAVRNGPLLVQRILQAGAAAATSVGTFLLTYAPFSDPIQRLHFLWVFQSTQSRKGHLIGFAGRVAFHPPWWANLWFGEQSLGTAATVFLLAAAALAVAFRRDRLTAFLVAALAGPLLFHCFVAGAAEGYYWTPWLPPLAALAALGVNEAARLVDRVSYRPAVAATLVVALAAPAWAAVSVTRTTAAIKTVGPPLLASVLDRHGLNGTLLSTGVYSFDLNYYLPSRAVLMKPPESLTGVDAVVVGAPACRLLPDNRTTRAIVAVNLANGRLSPIYRDRAMTVYEVSSTLEPVTPDDVARQPPTNLASGC